MYFFLLSSTACDPEVTIEIMSEVKHGLPLKRKSIVFRDHWFHWLLSRQRALTIDTRSVVLCARPLQHVRTRRWCWAVDTIRAGIVRSHALLPYISHIGSRSWKGNGTYHTRLIEGMGSTGAAVADTVATSGAAHGERNGAAKVAVSPRSSYTAVCGTVVLTLFEARRGGGGECHEAGDEQDREVHDGGKGRRSGVLKDFIESLTST